MNLLNKIDTTLDDTPFPKDILTAKLVTTFNASPLASQKNKLGDAEVLTKFYNPSGNEVWLITEAQKEGIGTELEDWTLYGLFRDRDGNIDYGFESLNRLINYSRTEHIPLTMENINVSFEIKRDVSYELELVNLKEACIKEFGSVPEAVQSKYGKSYLDSQRVVDLIATYEELVALNSEPHITEWFGDYGMHVIKYEISESQVEASYERALKSLGITPSEFQTRSDCNSRKGMVNAFRHSDRQIETNLGKVPIEDYREIVATQNGFDSYKEFYKAGLRIGNGYDLKPQDDFPKARVKTTDDSLIR